VGGGGQLQPSGVGAELPRGQVRQRPIEQVGEDLFDDGVAAVLGFGLGQLKRAVGKYRVIAVGGEQLALAFGGGAGVEVATRRTINLPWVAWAGEDANAV
jgi:hypothetical protein